MPVRVEDLTIKDVLRELSPAGLDYFAKLDAIDDGEPVNALLGKFVRFGKIMVIGSRFEYGESHGQRLPRLVHADIAYHMFRSVEPSIEERVRATAPEGAKGYLKDHWPVVDAGFSNIFTDENHDVEGIRLYRDSDHFGCGNLEVRRETLDLARQALGPKIFVTEA